MINNVFIISGNNTTRPFRITGSLALAPVIRKVQNIFGASFILS